MARVVKLVIALVIILAAMFVLSGIDSQKPVTKIEKPVKIDAPAP